MSKLRVLAFVDYYLPGYKGGGPAVSVSRLAQAVGDEVEFFVFTRDRDLGDGAPYESVEAGRWVTVSGTPVFYAPPDRLGLDGIRDAVREVGPDVVYVNSCFSVLTRRVLLLRRLGMMSGIGVVVAPRGEFARSALQMKAAKKRLYLLAARLFGLYRGVTWHVSSEQEREHAQRVFGGRARCFIRPPDLPGSVAATEPPAKRPGAASFVTLARISPMKNIVGAIEALSEIGGDVRLTVYGPIEDQAYFARCQEAVDRLPARVECEFAGPVIPQETAERLLGHNFFLFPTFGENFGHAIAEALAAGCPVLVSDRTPWACIREHGAGWVVPLEDRIGWRQALEACVAMDEPEYRTMCGAARALLEHVRASSEDARSGIELFRSALEKGHKHTIRPERAGQQEPKGQEHAT